MERGYALRQGSPADLRGIQTGGGSVHLMESDSLLTSIWQTFVVPPDPQQLSFEVLDVQLDQSTGGLPDALDVSLLDDQSQSLVPVATSGATAFFNLNPDNRVSVSPGVTWDGTNVTLDISQLTPGTSATLVFDLVGNQPLTNSVVTMDNVRVTPEAIYQDTFTASPLAGPFNNASSIYHCSYDGNNSHDIVVEDASLGGYVLFASDGAGGFTRDENVFGDKGAGGEGENDGRPIQIGEIVAHRIDEVGEIDGFTFEATSGQRLFFDDQGLGFNLFWRLLDPFGNLVFHELLSDHGVITLTDSGTYTLQIESGVFNATGPYQFQIYDVPATSTTAVAFSTPVVGAIDVPGEQDQFTFDASSGQILYFDAIPNQGGLRWELTDANGNSVFNHTFADDGPLEIVTTGSYLLTVYGNGDGVSDYRFQVNDVTPILPTSIEFNTSNRGEITLAGEADRYVIDGVAGQTVFFDAHVGLGVNLRVHIDDPLGNRLYDEFYDDIGPIQLNDNGEYTFTLSASDNVPQAYTFVLWDVPIDSPVVIPFDTPIPGALVVPGQSHRYQFEGLTGQAIVFDEIDPGSGIRYSLSAPSGTAVFRNVNSDRSVASLPETGTYTLLIDGNPKEAVGPYSFQIADGTSPSPLGPAANLEVKRVTAPTRVISRQAIFEIEWEVENVGNLLIPAGTQMTDRLYLSADGGLDDFATDPWLTSFRTQLAVDLLPGESVTRTETVQLPENIEGELQILVYVDADNEVFEGRRNELDSNIGGALVAVYPEPRELGGARAFPSIFRTEQVYQRAVPFR